AGVPLHQSTYTRRVYADSEPLATVEGKGFGLPSPTLGVSHDLTLDPNFRLGLAVLADYPSLQNWPSELEGRAPAPQRYAVENYKGTLLPTIALGAAYRFADIISVGAALNLLIGNFTAITTV